jgi:tRNA(fMet)-specific endonuclease VapC
VGLIVDTNVFIRFEKSGKAVNLPNVDSQERVYISAITVSELLIGVHRADTDERRQRRSTFVESVISGIVALDFTAGAARVHAELYAFLAKIGKMIGPNDLIIAATARWHDFAVLTDDVDEFSRVPGLQVIPFIP